jgi:hypothetical protein
LSGIENRPAAGERRPTIIPDHGPNVQQEPLEVPEVVKAAEDRADHFLREEAMAEIGPAESTGTGGTVARWIDG